MKKTLLTLCIGLFILSSSFAQYKKGGSSNDETKGSAMNVSVELGGTGLASLNFDSRFSKSQKGIGGRVGFGGFSIEGSSLTLIPITLNYLFGEDGRNYFEVGAGVTPVIVKSNDVIANTSEKFKSTFGHLTIGYRMQPSKSGFTFRANVVPIFGKGFFWPYWGGVSFGYKF